MAAACYPTITYGTVNFAIVDAIDSSDLRVRRGRTMELIIILLLIGVIG